jgi:hypothetical protein
MSLKSVKISNFMIVSDFPAEPGLPTILSGTTELKNPQRIVLYDSIVIGVGDPDNSGFCRCVAEDPLHWPPS